MEHNGEHDEYDEYTTHDVHRDVEPWEKVVRVIPFKKIVQHCECKSDEHEQ